MPQKYGDRTIETRTEARQAVTGHGVRYVLLWGLAGVIVVTTNRGPLRRTFFMRNMLKNLFRPPEVKTSRVAQLIQLESGGRARWTPRDYAALAREGYIANAIVHRAVKLVAENVAA